MILVFKNDVISEQAEINKYTLIARGWVSN